MDRKSTGRRIKAARQLIPLTVQEFADRLDLPGLGYKTLGSIERGERDLRPHEVAPLAQALEVPESFLVGEKPAGQDGLADRLDAIERALAEARSERKGIEEAVSTQATALTDQAGVLGELRDAVRDLRETITAQQNAAHQLEETAKSVDRAARETLERLQAAALPQAAGDQKT